MLLTRLYVPAPESVAIRMRQPGSPQSESPEEQIDGWLVSVSRPNAYVQRQRHGEVGRGRFPQLRAGLTEVPVRLLVPRK